MGFLRRLLLVVLAIPAFAQGGFDPVSSVKVGFDKGTVVVTAPEGAHLKAQFMKVEKTGGPGTITLGAMTPTNAKDDLGDPIWHGAVRIPVKGEGLSGTVKLAVTYQPCTEGTGGICYPPTTRELEVPASAIPGSTPVVKEAPKPAPVGAPSAETVRPVASAPVVPPAPAATPSSPASGGLFWLLIAAFGWGIVASLTPCVLPMIPITMAIIGAKGGGKMKGLMLSLTLVLGMAFTYTILGVVAAKTGAAFGAAAQKPAFLVPVALLFALLALSLFGAFELRLPSAFQTKLQSGARKGFGGAFIMGLILGPISAPCVGPFIGAQLLDIAQRGEVLVGALTLFVFALGMGVLFVIGGTASAALPRSGDWLTRLKQLMGLVILGFAAWTLRYIVPAWLNWTMWSLVAFLAAPALGAFEAATGLTGGLRKGLGILALACGVLLGLRGLEAGFAVKLLPSGGGAAPALESQWMSQDLEGALLKAKAEHKVVLVDIYAEWCASCHELDDKTWSDAQVKAWIQANTIAVRIDTDAVRKDLAIKLKIGSYPTVLVLDAEGQEQKRILGYQPPAEMLAFLKSR
ncbi:MAG TPA: cytochrome c biogenesis protein CcdA [Holophagaceae bacterium]|jgi:thiol:disulfide interchange protein DsbD|nr:cytochrome c biogenesis protein CcdA [Holophagaceae bacterium]